MDAYERCTNLGKKNLADSVAIYGRGRELFRPPTTPAYTMKAYAGVEVQSLIPNFIIRWRYVQLHTPNRLLSVNGPPKHSVGPYSHQHRDFVEQKNFLGLPGIEQFLTYPDNRQVAIQTQNHDISKKGGPTSEWRSEPLFPCPRSGGKHVMIRLVNSISHFNKPELSDTTGQPSEQFNNYLLGKIVPNLVEQSTSRRKVCEQFCTLYQSLLLQKC